MAVNLGNPTWVTLVADADTPAAFTAYAGRIIGIPPGITLPTTHDTITVSGVTVPGYARPGPGGNGVEWVMQAAVDPNIAALNAIPGPAGWTDTSARDVYKTLGAALLTLGVPGTNVRTGFKQLYDAAVADYVAAHP